MRRHCVKGGLAQIATHSSTPNTILRSKDAGGSKMLQLKDKPRLKVWNSRKPLEILLKGQRCYGSMRNCFRTPLFGMDYSGRVD